MKSKEPVQKHIKEEIDKLNRKLIDPLNFKRNKSSDNLTHIKEEMPDGNKRI